MNRAVDAQPSPRSSRSTTLEWWIGGGERFTSRYRLLEVASVAAFGYFAVGLAVEIGAGLPLTWHALLLVPIALAGLVGADLVSGLVHWLADTYWRADTTFWGPKFLAPFREHHVDPLAITRHDFIEANCDNCLVSLLVLAPAYWLVPVRESFVGLLVAAFVLAFSLCVLLTSIAHGWAHMSTPPAFACWLQRWGLVISPKAHAHHHVAPHKTHYCITLGWLNPLLDRTRFFRHLERVLDALGAPRAEHD